jgi:hypothetical protein
MIPWYIVVARLQRKEAFPMDIIAQSVTVFLANLISSLTAETQADFGARMQQAFQAGCSMLTQIIPAILAEMDYAIANDPKRMKEWRILRMDERTILTVFGELHFKRRYYQHKTSGETAYLLDRALGIPSHAKVSDDVRQAAVVAAESSPYSKSAESASVSGISKMSVCNYVADLDTFPELKAEGEKRSVEHLYVEADEDHVPLQDGRNVRKKLVYIHEGARSVGKRRVLVNPRYLTWPLGGSSEALWEEVSNYIEQQYVLEEIEHIFLSGDCASWIREGEHWLYPCVPILDGFHSMKALRSLCAGKPGRMKEFMNLVRADRRDQAVALCQAILNETPEKQRKGKLEKAKYLLNNWVRIRNQRHPGAQGCSAEGHVSHILSARLSSRPKGWSQHNMENMAGLRVMKANGQLIDYVQLSRGKASGKGVESSAEVKELMESKDLRKSLKKASKELIKIAQASIPILTTGKTSPLYQALHGLSSHFVA